jgi:hypothetical protein
MEATMARKGKSYWALLERQPNGTWAVAFGDWSKDVVQQERRDMHESFPNPKLKDLKVVETDGTDADAMRWCRELNATGV